MANRSNRKNHTNNRSSVHARLQARVQQKEALQFAEDQANLIAERNKVIAAQIKAMRAEECPVCYKKLTRQDDSNLRSMWSKFDDGFKCSNSHYVCTSCAAKISFPFNDDILYECPMCREEVDVDYLHIKLLFFCGTWKKAMSKIVKDMIRQEEERERAQLELLAEEGA